MTMPYRPPFTITPRLIDLVSRISEEVGRWAAAESGISPRLRRENRIRSIHASLAIENNTLSLEQVSAIIEGKRVLGHPREIQEVKNALAAYDLMPSLAAADQQADEAPFAEFILQAILDGLTSSPSTAQVNDQVSDQVKALLRCMDSDAALSAGDLMLRLHLSHKATFRKNYLNPALVAGLLEMTEPASPRSPTQKYKRKPHA